MIVYEDYVKLQTVPEFEMLRVVFRQMALNVWNKVKNFPSWDEDNTVEFRVSDGDDTLVEVSARDFTHEAIALHMGDVMFSETPEADYSHKNLTFCASI